MLFTHGQKVVADDKSHMTHGHMINKGPWEGQGKQQDLTIV